MIPPVLEESLGFNIYRAGLLFRRELMLALSDFNMTPEQWQIMVSLWHSKEGLSQKEIVNVLLKDKHTVSRMIKRLERDGWIRKSNRSDDARVTLIELTQKGRSFEELISNKLKTHFDILLEDLDESETMRLIDALKNIRKLLGDYS